MDKLLKLVYFSPTDTTKNVLYKVASDLGIQINEEFNLTNFEYCNFEHTFNENDLIILGSPVYGARVPKTAKNRFNGLRGQNTNIILILTYGDVHYGDALIEFYQIMKNKGFSIIGMGIFVTRHNVIKCIGINRPDENDFLELKLFCKKLIKNIKENKYIINKIETKKIFGKNNKLPIKPIGNRNCKNCGLCIKLCPENAIEQKNPRKTIKGKCICCMRCVKFCPYKARNLSKIVYFVSKLFVRIMKIIKYNHENKNEIIV
jgi:ferredoxin